MGQHHTNPTAIAYKNGEIAPKKRPMGKPEERRLLYAMVSDYLMRKNPLFGMVTERSNKGNGKAEENSKAEVSSMWKRDGI